MAVNYADERFQQVETEKQNALSEIEKTYSGLIDQSDAFYQNQIEASKQWEEQQKQLQQQQTDFALQQIEQQKEQERKDYIKEQSGAYVDWQKQSNQYGVNAEKIAAGGMTNTGFAESSQVSMYNTYQNRVAMARESFRGIIQDYNNAMTQAQMQNNAALAQIAYESMQKRLELELESFLHKSQLELALLGEKKETEQIYHARYQDVLAQINQENALAEQIRQYNASLAEEQRQFNASLAEQQRQFDLSHNGDPVIDSPVIDPPVITGSYSNSAYAKKAEMEDQKAQSTIKSTGSRKPVVTPFVGSTYKQATTYLEKYGILNKVASDLMTPSKWEHLKKNGSTAPSVRNYSSYNSYVTALCKAAVERWG